jgi:hypothetical protein
MAEDERDRKPEGAPEDEKLKEDLPEEEKAKGQPSEQAKAEEQPTAPLEAEEPSPAASKTDTGQAEVAKAPEPEAGKKKAPKAKGPVRVKTLLALIIIFGLFYLLLLDPLSRYAIERYGSLALRAPVKVGSVTMSPLRGVARLGDLEVGDPSKEGENILVAREVHLEFEVLPLLRRRFVVREARLTEPRLHVKRGENGQFNLEDVGKSPEEREEEAREGEKKAGKERKIPSLEELREKAQKQDWLRQAREWVKKLKERIDRRRREKEGKGEKRKGILYGDVAEYMLPDSPRVVVHRLVADDLEVTFSDAARGESMPGITDATLLAANLSSKPSKLEEPIRVEVCGKLSTPGPVPDSREKKDKSGESGGPPTVDIRGEIDLRGETGRYRLTANGARLPVKILRALYDRSLPVHLQKGLLDLTANAEVRGFEALQILSRLNIADVHMEPKEEEERILGLESGRFCRELNEAGSFEVPDLKVTGSVLQPRVHWGDTMKNIVLTGGKNYAKKRMKEAMEKGKEKLKEKVPGSEGLLEDMEKGLKKGLDFFKKK